MRLPKICFKRPVIMSFTGKIKPQSLAPGKPSANAREALECIEKNSPLGQIVQKTENTLKLQGAIVASLRENGLEKAVEWIQIGGLIAGELKLHTQHAAISTRINQKAPSIISRLQQQGLAIERISVRQTPGGSITPHPESTLPTTRLLSPKAHESLEQLLEKLDAGSTLFGAVKKLLKR